MNLCFPSGSRPVLTQELTPTSVHVTRASPLCTQRIPSPSPAIINFTLQNLGLISGHNQTQTGPVSSPGPVSLQPRGMVFFKPVSPLQLQNTGSGQQVALISLQQVNTTAFVFNVKKISLTQRHESGADIRQTQKAPHRNP